MLAGDLGRGTGAHPAWEKVPEEFIWELSYVSVPWHAHKMTIQPDPQSVITFILNIPILRKRGKNYSPALNQCFVIHSKFTF